MSIIEFQGEYRWLSNFSPCVIYIGKFRFGSVENAYQAMKDFDNHEWISLCQNKSSGEIKIRSKSIPTPFDWDSIKEEIMNCLLVQKFNQDPYKTQLILTGKQHIQEGNMWGDTFWGVDLLTSKGRNILGNQIMKLREQLMGDGLCSPSPIPQVTETMSLF